MTNQKVLYAELTPKEFREKIAQTPIAYLPLGTLEWHGEHLPIGADGLQSQGFFIELAKEVGGIVLPMLFLGPDRKEVVDEKDYYGMDIYGFRDSSPQQLDGSAYWVEESLFRQLIESTLYLLKRAGFKIVVAHGHGPSTGHFKNWSKELGEKLGMKLFVVWRQDESDGLGIQTDHAAANETSLLMALRPELVQMENLPEDLDVWPVAVGGKDPRIYASGEQGKKAIAMQVERMADILRKALNEI
ncbi:creatininase family protein [bacterium]|nr:creatininase family protein [bacterium]